MFPGQINQQMRPPPSNGYAPPPNGYAQPPNGYAPPGQPPYGYAPTMPVPMPATATMPHGMQQSTCQGNKKALLIGINYAGQRGELRGCLNDVRNIRHFISSRYAFPTDPLHMVVLTDDQHDPNFRPEKRSILNAMHWLISGCRPGDSLFLHYSGHGGLVKDREGDEADGYDSCIYPVDHQRAGPILDDEIHAILVRPLPPGVRLTAIFDCCHSGTGMDLPYLYNPDGTLLRYNPNAGLMDSLKQAGKLAATGRTTHAVTTLLSAGMKMLSGSGSGGGGHAAEQYTQQTRTSVAEVIMFSGCKDNQTSADTFIGGVGATGAMSYALIKALTEQPQQTYLSLLSHVRAILHREYSQKPQLSSGFPMDMNRPFFM